MTYLISFERQNFPSAKKVSLALLNEGTTYARVTAIVDKSLNFNEVLAHLADIMANGIEYGSPPFEPKHDPKQENSLKFKITLEEAKALLKK